VASSSPDALVGVGNTSSEDFLQFCGEMGVDTRVDEAVFVDVAERTAAMLDI
jgi:hypothetical protein